MGEKPKLLIVTTIPNTIRAFLIPYACFFRGLGWRVDAMARDITRFEGLSIHFDKTIDASWSRNPLDPSNIPAFRHIRQTVFDEGYDIVHVHTPVAAFVTRAALRKPENNRPKVVYTAHGFHFCRGCGSLKNFIYRSLEKTAGRWTDRLIVINREDYDAAARGIVPAEKSVYMPGIGLDFSKYDPARVHRADVQQMRDQLGLKPDDVLFAMIAEFIPRKRHKDVIDALAKTRNPRVHVAFAGNGPLFDKIKRRADSEKLHNRAHFMDDMKDVRPIIMASRAVILPSEREGLARALMESACLGVPIIGSDARGIRDVVRPGRGLLYPTGDIFALRDAMLQMSEAPHPTIKPDPAWRIENIIEAHEKLYALILGGPERGEGDN